MPSRDKFYRCYCAECCEADRNGRAGNPAGKLQLERHKAIHLRETSLDPAISDVHRASVANLALRAISQQDDSGNSGIDSLSAALFASSLCDNGPDLDSQPSKLWASHEEFQEAASTNTGDIGIPNIGDLVDAVGRISTENRSVAFPLSHTSINHLVYVSGIAKTLKGENSRPTKFSILLKLRFGIFSSIPSNRRQLMRMLSVHSLEV